MTITAVRQVTSVLMSGPDFDDSMSRTDVGKLIGENGVSPHTVSVYLTESKPGGRYADRPFPAPNGYFGARPYWKKDRADEIREWDANRVGRGAGGGQPAHQRNRA